MLELEKTYLPKYLPEGWEKSLSKEIFDIYYPKEAKHPVLRLRKIGEKCELTKKEELEGQAATHHKEDTIRLSPDECAVFLKLRGKESYKLRYYFPYQNHTAELTIFHGKLRGLILVDFEFANVEEMQSFSMPDFCLSDVTEDEFAAGGMLAGKSFEDIEEKLKEYGYKPIYV